MFVFLNISILNCANILILLICINQSTAGTMCTSKKLMIRLIIGAWCLLAFVLVTAYQSVLVSFIMAPGIEPPLIKSLSDLVVKEHIHISVDKGKAFDMFLSVTFFNLFLHLKAINLYFSLFLIG